MKKVGILLNSIQCNKYLYETIEVLNKSNLVEIYFLLNQEKEKDNSLTRIATRKKSRGLNKLVDFLLFKVVTTFEYKLLSFFFPKIKKHNEVKSLEGLNNKAILHLSPIFSPSGLVVRYQEQDINKIKELDLDIILRGNAKGIFKGDILNVAKDGILSFHHGDNRWNRGGPAGFWEVYLKKTSTGFIIQKLTEELDGGHVLFRGNIETKRSYTENFISIYKESYPHMAEFIIRYATNNCLPAPEVSVPFGEPILTNPSKLQLFRYFLNTCTLNASIILKKITPGSKKKRWSVAYLNTSWEGATLRKGVEIKNPPFRFFADPFVVTKDGKTVCFVEDFYYKEGRACITAVEILDKKNYKILGTVIKEPFHLSFPYIFEYEGDMYMIPETAQSKAIRLYKCVEFPMKWEYQYDIMNNISAVDTMVFEHDGMWWLFTNTSSVPNGSHCSKLMAYYADSPLSRVWTPHKQNPLIFDPDNARNAGILNFDGAFKVRCRQKQGFNFYGASLTLAKIKDLTPTSYSEEQIAHIQPNFFPNIKGCHHIHSNGSYTVYDYIRNETLK